VVLEVLRYGSARGEHLKLLEEENARLKKLLAKAMLDKEALRGVLGRKY